MIFLYNKTTKEVKSISEGQIKFSNKNFSTKEIKPTKEEQTKIDKGYKLKIVRGKLKTEKSSAIIEEETKEEFRCLKEKAEKGELSNNEIQKIISNLI